MLSLDPIAMSAADYRGRFPAILVKLDWARFAQERWSIANATITEREQLLSLRSAFGKRFGRVQPRFLKTTMLHSMRIGEAAHRIVEFSSAQQAVIEAKAAAFRDGQAPVQLDIPAYPLRDGTIFVMDGNHRCTALAISGVAFAVNLFLVQGPADHAFRGMHFRWESGGSQLRLR